MKLIILIIFFLGMFSYSSNKKIDYTSSSNEKIIINNNELEELEVEPEKEEPKQVESTPEYSNLNKISVEDFKGIVKKEDKIILVVTGTTCIHCKNYKPRLNEVLKENNKKAYEIDAWTLTTDEKNELVEIIGEFQGVPHTVLMEKGKVIHTEIGELQKEGITEMLKTNGFIN